jgi:hypothetical protein
VRLGRAVVALALLTAEVVWAPDLQLRVVGAAPLGESHSVRALASEAANDAESGRLLVQDVRVWHGLSFIHDLADYSVDDGRDYRIWAEGSWVCVSAQEYHHDTLALRVAANGDVDIVEDGLPFGDISGTPPPCSKPP